MKTTEQIYRQDPRINASLLKLFNGSLDLRIARYKAIQPSFATDAMNLGSAVHDLLENDMVLSDRFIQSDFKDFKTKAAREWKQEMKDTGKIILKDSELTQAVDMALEVKSNAPAWMFEGQHEKPFYTDEFKALLDAVNGKRGVDWKTSQATSLEQWERDALKYGYHLQAYHYMMTAQLEEFWFVVVSSVAPYPVWVLKCSDSFLAHGQEVWERAYANYNASPEQVKIGDLDAPRWWQPSESSTQEFKTEGEF